MVARLQLRQLPVIVGKSPPAEHGPAHPRGNNVGRIALPHRIVPRDFFPLLNIPVPTTVVLFAIQTLGSQEWSTQYRRFAAGRCIDFDADAWPDHRGASVRTRSMEAVCRFSNGAATSTTSIAILTEKR